jgi:hypothetical protein
MLTTPFGGSHMAKYANILHTLLISYVKLEDWEMHDQTNTGWIYATIHEKYYTNISLLKHDVRFSTSRKLKAMFKVSTLSFHAGIALYLNGAVYHNFVTKRSSRLVARCKSADQDSFMVHAWRCVILFSSCRSGIPDEMDQQYGVFVTLI